MPARHENELLRRLERIVDIGYVEIHNNELLIWYNQERFTYTIWRDVAEKWYDLLDAVAIIPTKDKKTPLLVGNFLGGYVFLWGKGLVLTESSWLQDIRSLAKLKFEDTTMYYVIFHPTSIGVSAGQRGPVAELRSSPYPTLEAAVLDKDATPPRSGYVAVKIVDDTGNIYRERTAGHNIAAANSVW